MTHVVDTNVLIAASAHAVLPEQRDATPGDIGLRKKVYTWLDELSRSDATIVLDYQFGIQGEYQNKLDDQDFGIQVIIDKQNRNQVIWVSVEYDEDRYALLPPELDGCRWDRSDKKFGSAAFQAKSVTDHVNIVNASDTDWYDVHAVLAAHAIGLHQLIDAWCRAKYREKNGCEPPAV